MVKSIAEDIKRTFQQGNTLTRIIIVNIAVFVVINLIYLFSTYANGGTTPQWYVTITHWLSLSSDPLEALLRPWTWFTHMFLHTGFWHILWNMLFLYWFGRILGDFLGDQKVLPIYLLGGLMGGIFYFLSANILPYGSGQQFYAMGASAAAMAMVVGSATLSPDYNMRLLLIGDVKLKYIAAVLVFIDLIGTAGSMNTGGHFGHIGGALMGYLYIDQLRKGNNLGHWIERIADWKWSDHRRKLRVVHKNDHIEVEAQMDEEAELNRILDKIKEKGLGSLSDNEKSFLKKMSES
ncbi:MAG: rhomboid family intramembrane serine protease [Saprospiraceae bacterium]|nr:rhomboid family intramembrane serine protease [Saprospiraceae bacterium]